MKTQNNNALNSIMESIQKIISETEKIKAHSELSKKLLTLFNELELKKFSAFERLSFPVLITSLSPNGNPGKIIYVNNSLLKYTDEKTDNLINKSISRFIKKREKLNEPFFSEKIWDKILKEKNFVFNLIFELHGEKRNVELNTFLYKFIDENYVVFVINDITKEIKYLSLLEEEKNRYKYFFEHSDSAVYRVEFPKPVSTKLPLKKQAKLIFETGILAECNSRFAHEMGFGEPDVLEGRTVQQIFGSWENSKNKQLISQFVKNKYVLRGHIFPYLTLQGETVYFSIYLFGIIKDNKLKEIWASYYDVTELEETKQNLKKSHDEVYLLMENSPISMALLDEELNTLLFNNIMKDTFGYSEKELPDLASWYLGPLNVGGDPGRNAKKWAVFARKLQERKINVVKKETLIKTKSGEIKNTIVFLSFIGGKFLVSITDVTELQKAKQEAERAKQIIEKSPNLLIQWELKNNRFKQIFITKNISKLGYNSDEIKKSTTNFRKIIVNNSVEIFRERKNAALKGKKFIKQSLEIITKEKKSRFYESYIAFIYENNRTLLWEILTDITEKHLAELKLRENIEQYRSILENSPIGILQFDNKGNIISFNSSFLEIFGVKPHQILKINMTKHIKNVDVKKIAKEALRGKPGKFEGNYISILSEKKVYIRFIAQPIFDEKGKVISVIGLVEDISESKKALQELEKTRDAFKQTAEQLNFILNHLNDIVYEQNVDENFAYISGSVKKVLGYFPNEFILNRKELLTDNPINKKIDENLRKVLLNKETVRYHIEIFAKNGRKVLLEVNESPVIRKGKVTGLIGVARDVTDSYKHNLLREALYLISSETIKAKTLPQLYEFIHKIISRFMPADNFFIAVWQKNENLIKFEYYVDEMDSENPGSLVPRNGFTEYAINSKLNAVLLKKDIQKLLDDGKFQLIGTLPESIAVANLQFTNGNEGVMVLQDYYDKDAYGKDDLDFLKIVSTQIVQSIEKKIADEELIKTNELLKKREIELSKQAEELKISNANKDRLFSIIAHDLRSPFTALLGLTNMLNEMIDDFTLEEIKEMVTSLDSSARGLYKLLENLLNWSRLQLGTFKIKPKKINLYFIALNVKEYLENPASQKNIEIKVQIPDDLTAYADENTVESIIRNLVNNSIKFTNPGGTITIKAKHLNNDYVEVTIEDTGIGMSEDILSNLFKIDKKVSRPGTNSEPGTGLGLILVKEFVERNKGTIRVESKVNVGSKFIFTLPAKEK